jgi:hypothetical protein
MTETNIKQRPKQKILVQWVDEDSFELMPDDPAPKEALLLVNPPLQLTNGVKPPPPQTP